MSFSLQSSPSDSPPMKSSAPSPPRASISGKSVASPSSNSKRSKKIAQVNINDDANSSLELLITKLKDDLHHEMMIQRKVSYLLRDFYSHFSEHNQEEKAKYHKSIVFANQCLLVSSYKQAIIEEEIKKQEFAGGAHLERVSPGEGVLAFRKITIPLQRNCKTALQGTFLFCMVRYKRQIYESPFINLSSLKKAIVLSVDKIYDGLEPDFQVEVEIYSMKLEPWMLKESTQNNQWSSWWWSLFGSFSRSNHTTSSSFSHGQSDKMDNIQVVSVNRIKMDQVPVVDSSFNLIGSILIDRSNWNVARRPLEHYPITDAVCGDSITTDLQLTIEYDRLRQDGVPENSFAVHIESRYVDCLVTSNSMHLHFKFKWTKCSLYLEKNFLKILRIGLFGRKSITSYDFNRCINALELPQQVIDGMTDNSFCLIFAKATPDKYQFVFIGSDSSEAVNSLINRMIDRISIIRKWNNVGGSGCTRDQNLQLYHQLINSMHVKLLKK